MAVDYKKEYRELYSPKTTPMTVDVPEIRFVAVEGRGHPQDAEYQQAIPLLYGVQYTIKMSKKGDFTPDGYFDYVVPPLESLWWLDGGEDWTSKSKYNWIAMIRLPEFVDEKVFEWACDEVSKKKRLDTKTAKYLKVKEGLCVQCLHVGSYDDEPKTLKLIDDFIEGNSLQKDVSPTRRHHEIYLSNPEKTVTEKLKTILRIPVKNRNL